ncbi:MAG: hypothetical protein MO846_08330 [Candidatus Devosia symbiotica]|nr:hypothetical protein [Candidatus Devosia symbiotica]
MTAFDDTVAKLMEGVKVDIPDTDLAAAVAAQTKTDAPAQLSSTSPVP